MRNVAQISLNRVTRSDLLEIRIYIIGERIDVDTYLAAIAPAGDEKNVEVAHGDVMWVDRAVEAARAAFPAWRDLLPVERGTMPREWAALTQDQAVIMAAEQGKPQAKSLGKIAFGAAFLDWFAAERERCYSETIPSYLPGSQLLIKWQPIGVMAAIAP